MIKKRKKKVQKIDIDNDGVPDVVVTTYEKEISKVEIPTSLPRPVTVTEIKLCKTKNCGNNVYESNGVRLDYCAECARGFKLL